jgi:ABC-type branched-subunit amino acid transport system permease subunit
MTAQPPALAAVSSTTGVRVTRSRRPVRLAGVALLILVALLAYLPFAVYAGTINTLINLFYLLVMASMWNLLAGYAGLISVGQQAYIGLGAYIVLILAQQGLDPFLAVPFAAIGCAVVALPVSVLLLRLRGGYFAIATWVVADAFQLVISRVPSLGGGTGATLPGVGRYSPTVLVAVTYWTALAVMVVTLGGVYLLLRGRLGLVLTAIRDNEAGARNVGAQVLRAKRTVYLVAAAGCGAAGAVVLLSQLNVQSVAAFSVSWSAQMIFVTVIGGIGSIEGPIIGTLVFFALQQSLADQGAWYLVVLGAVAIAIALWAPRGIWGLVSSRVHARLFPVGYWLWPGEAGRRS